MDTEGIDTRDRRLTTRVSWAVHELLRVEARRSGVSMSRYVRECIERALPPDQLARMRAVQGIFEMEPTEVSDWPEMKRQMVESRVADITLGDPTMGLP